MREMQVSEKDCRIEILSVRRYIQKYKKASRLKFRQIQDMRCFT